MRTSGWDKAAFVADDQSNTPVDFLLRRPPWKNQANCGCLGVTSRFLNMKDSMLGKHFSEKLSVTYLALTASSAQLRSPRPQKSVMKHRVPEMMSLFMAVFSYLAKRKNF